MVPVRNSQHKSIHEQVGNICFGSERQSVFLQHREKALGSPQKQPLMRIIISKSTENLNFCRKKLQKKYQDLIFFAGDFVLKHDLFSLEFLQVIFYHRRDQKRTNPCVET